ncbi:alpha/beta hydrolase [Sphingomonadales bacterium 56]|uniref:alpha/beta fold hydrolase n=1 Tax=unclassified Sphingobium TaxID=2611147 RepID=UPI001918C955|nr:MULTISPECIES: alpha/beta hydrolase [unclassified Sphingobium]MBY2928800.1 alpha/beta hydrolase [Sphingomonadales bacterium 56]MBY2959349.1 alpha/beta hydrolase [Sphingomonadales bacterium 58]CAD7338055.1 Arylesterase [Sphingobium sp. S6]CAD7338829.1 Arylesterase [Sphingobium sp. S8]
MHIETSEGHVIHVKDMGSGHPVILIHGWPLTGDMWEYQTLALLEAGYRVITYDRRGFGQSGHPADGYNYDVFAADLAAVIDKVGAPKVSLVGFSMGGGEIARYLSRFGSAKVDRVALVGSVVPYMLKDDSNPDGVDDSVFDQLQAQVREDRFAFLQSFAKTFYGIGLVSKPVSNGLLDWTFALAIMASPKATVDCINAFGRTDFRPDLPAFDIPTLIIHGTSDKTVPIDPTGRAAAAAIPGAQLIEYDGEPHGLFATAPDRLNADLLDFLAR